MDQLLKQALVGTGKPLKERTFTHALELNLLSLDWSAERKLLLRNAITCTAKEAGLATSMNAESIPESKPESRKPVSSRLSEILLEILNHTSELFMEALELIHEKQLIVPPAVLPTILHASDKRHGPLLGKLIGERGHWLCQFHPDWKKKLSGASLSDTLPPDADQLWEEGTLSERLAMLKLARKTDQERSRRWLSTGWAKEKAEHRQQLLESLIDSVTNDDLPFLESLSTDASKKVKLLATRLLCRIPNSSIQNKLRHVVEPWLQYTPPKNVSLETMLTRKLMNAGPSTVGTLVITLPNKFDPAWNDFGITEKPPNGISQKAFLFQQFIELIPPEDWVDRFKVSPAFLIAASIHEDEGLLLLESWTRATIQYKSFAWIPPLWDAWNWLEVKKNDHVTMTKRWHFLVDLLRLLPKQHAGARLVSFLEEGGEDGVSIEEMLFSLASPWSHEFSVAYLNHVRKIAMTCDTLNYSSYGLVNSLIYAAACIPKSGLSIAMKEWTLPEKENYVVTHWREKIREFHVILQLKQRFLTELNRIDQG